MNVTRSLKRKPKGLGTFKRKNDLVEHRKRKRDKRDGGKLSDSSEPAARGGGGGRMKMAKTAKHFGNVKKDFNKGIARGQKRKIDQAVASKKREAVGDKRSFDARRAKKFRGKQ